MEASGVSCREPLVDADLRRVERFYQVAPVGVGKDGDADPGLVGPW